MNTRERTGIEIFIAASLVGLVAVFSFSCRQELDVNPSNLNSLSDEWIEAGEQLQASASPTPDDAFNIHFKIGIADVRNDGTGCLRTKNGNLAENKPVTVIISLNEPPHKILNAKVEGKREESCARRASESGDTNPGKNFFYSLKLEEGASAKIPGFENGIAVIGPEKPIETRQGLAVSDLNGDGKPEYFRSCSGYEGTHFTIWTGEPLRGERIWHSFYYVDYATVPDCKDEEWEKEGEEEEEEEEIN